MKNQITQFSGVIIAFIAIIFLMSYTRPIADEPKQYMVVRVSAAGDMINTAKLEAEVNKRLSEGWRVQGGITASPPFQYQTMVK